MIGLQHFPVVNVDDPDVHGVAVAYKEDSNGRYILVAWDDGALCWGAKGGLKALEFWVRSFTIPMVIYTPPPNPHAGGCD